MGSSGAPRPCPADGGLAEAGGREPPPPGMAVLGSPVRGEGREGSWTLRRFMGLSGEQVPPQAAHCLASLTKGLLPSPGRPPLRPARAIRAPAPIGASLRASSVRPSQASRAGRPSQGTTDLPGPRGPRAPTVRPRPWRPRLSRRRALGSARLARPAPPRPGRTHRGPFFPAPRNHMANPRRHSSPRSFRRRMSRKQGTITTLFASIMDANGREEKKNHLTPRDSQLITNHMGAPIQSQAEEFILNRATLLGTEDRCPDSTRITENRVGEFLKCPGELFKY